MELKWLDTEKDDNQYYQGVFKVDFSGSPKQGNTEEHVKRTRLGFKTCLSKTKTKTQQFQDQDQDFDVQDQDRDSRLTRPILEVHDWDGLWQTKGLKESWQAENLA